MPKGHIETGSLEASIATIASEAIVCKAMMPKGPCSLLGRRSDERAGKTQLRGNERPSEYKLF
jgi:hypothetical protein